MISKKIQSQIIEAMKAKNEVRMSTLKLLSAALHNAKIAKQDVLTKEEELKIVRVEVKKRKDAIEIYEKASAGEKAEREKQELKVLEEYLPKDLTDEELEKMIDETIIETGAKDMKDMGKIIGLVMQKAKGKADGKKVAELVKSKL
jgi:uncharacterized protein YqeY